MSDPTAARPDSTLFAGAICGLLAATIWGGFPAITKLSIASNALDAFDVTALRFGVGGLILLPLFVRGGLRGVRWPRALFLVCGAGAPYVLLTAGGLKFAPAAHMGVITPSCMLVTATLGSRLLLGDRLSAGRMLGVATILAGILLLGWDGLVHQAAGAWLGDLMFAAGGVFWASYTIGSRIWAVPPLHATVLVVVLSLLLYVPPYLVLDGASLLAAPWHELAIQAVFQGVLSAVVALLLYTRAVALLGAARGSLFAALVPTVTLLIAVPVLGEWPTAPQLGGVALVTAGMLLALGLVDRIRRRTTPPA